MEEGLERTGQRPKIILEVERGPQRARQDTPHEKECSFSCSFSFFSRFSFSCSFSFFSRFSFSCSFNFFSRFSRSLTRTLVHVGYLSSVKHLFRSCKQVRPTERACQDTRACCLENSFDSLQECSMGEDCDVGEWASQRACQDTPAQWAKTVTTHKICHFMLLIMYTLATEVICKVDVVC